MNVYGFFLNGETLLKKVVAPSLEAAKSKLDFFYPENFNIEIRIIGKFQPLWFK